MLSYFQIAAFSMLFLDVLRQGYASTASTSDPECNHGTSSLPVNPEDVKHRTPGTGHLGGTHQTAV